VHGVAAGGDGRTDDRPDVEVARRRGGGADPHHGVGAAGSEAVAVGVGHGGDRLDALVEARPHDPYGDLPAVGDEHAPQAHGAGSGWT
jgi:hypothetical protein